MVIVDRGMHVPIGDEQFLRLYHHLRRDSLANQLFPRLSKALSMVRLARLHWLLVEVKEDPLHLLNTHCPSLLLVRMRLRISSKGSSSRMLLLLLKLWIMVL